MAPHYTNPRLLVEALQQRGDGARAQLWELLRAPLSRLMSELRVRYGLSRNGESLTHHALHAAETYLRTRPVNLFESMTWSAFRAGILLHLAKLASQPYGQLSGQEMRPESLPQSPSYHSEILFLPHERVGDHWFGGDWFGGQEAPDGSLWVIVADITGHGYYAYLLACMLPGVWAACWETRPAAPTELLGAMHELLADCLPEGVYVECTLARLHPEGEVIVVPAGGSRLLWRRGQQGQPALLKFRGTWLGLAAPSAGDQHTWTLEHGDELVLATDGMFDQLCSQSESDMVESLGRGGPESGLFDRVRDLLRLTLARNAQRDDITMVLLRRRNRIEMAASTPGRAESPSPNEMGDVSV